MTTAVLTFHGLAVLDTEDELMRELHITRIRRVQAKRAYIILTVESELPAETLEAKVKPIGFFSIRVLSTGESTAQPAQTAPAVPTEAQTSQL